MAWNRIQLCVLLAALCVGIATAQTCLSVNDVLPQMPKDLQEIVRQRMDALSFRGTFFVPTAEAWKARGLDGRVYTQRMLGSILDIGIIPGVRFAERPTADRRNGTVQLESQFKDNDQLFCLTVDDPDNKLDVEIRVTGSPNADDKSRYSVTPIQGNTFKAGNGTITIVKVYSDIKTQNLTATTDTVSYMDAIRNSDEDELERVFGKHFNRTLMNLSSWTPANVVRVVQCERVDIFFTDHLLLPCPLCGDKCSALIVNKLVMIFLPITSVFAAILAVTGYVAMCFGDKLFSQCRGACGCFFKVVCGSIMFVVVLLELVVVGAFIGYAHYFYKFGHENKTLAEKDKWRPYLIWSVVGAVLTSVIVLSHVWSIFTKSCKRKHSTSHKEFHNPPPPPQTQFYTTPGAKYTPVGAVPPMTA